MAKLTTQQLTEALLALAKATGELAAALPVTGIEAQARDRLVNACRGIEALANG